MQISLAAISKKVNLAQIEEGSQGPYKMKNGRSSSLFFQNLRNEPTVVVDLGGTTEKFSTGYDGFCAQVSSGRYA
jgi:hypothetical protein